MSDHESVEQKETIDYFVEQPIHCGYLLAFCDSQYCAENIRFAMEVERIRDKMEIDGAAWGNKSWREKDEEAEIDDADPDTENGGGSFDFEAYFKNNRNRNRWPSTVVLREDLESDVIYTCEVFSEALIDPLKTMKKDILPRFLVSEHHRELLARLDSITSLPPASALDVAPPEVDAKIDTLTQRDINSGLIDLDVMDSIQDRMIYTSFLAFLRSIVSSENLLCMRMIYTFREIFKSRGPNCQAKASDFAWTIYKFFIAPGSAFEISLSTRRRKEVMHRLAAPEERAFEKVEKSALSALRVHFDDFKKSREYPKLIISVQSIMNETKQQDNPVKCFTFK